MKKRHRLSKLFRPMTPSEYQGLKASLKQHGFWSAHPIVLWKDAIIDGFHRARACDELGIKPIFVTLNVDTEAEAEAYVRSANSRRRHLTIGEQLQHELWHAEQQGEKYPSSSTLASMAGSSRAVAAQHLKLRKEDPTSADKVMRGEMTTQKALAPLLPKSKGGKNPGTTVTAKNARGNKVVRVELVSVTKKQRADLKAHAAEYHRMQLVSWLKFAIAEQVKRDKKAGKVLERAKLAGNREPVDEHA